MSTYTKGDLLVLPRGGEQTGTHMTIKIRSAEMGGDFSVMEGLMQPRSLLSPHTHDREDQAVIVLSGMLEFEVGGEGGLRFTAPAGSYIKKPRQVQHCFWNPTDEPVSYVELSGRDGFEGFVDAMTSEGSIGGVLEGSKTYAMTWHFERVPGLMKRNNLKRISGVEMPWEKLAEFSPRELLDKLRQAVTACIG